MSGRKDKARVQNISTKLSFYAPFPPRNTFKISLGAWQVKDCLKTGTKQSLVWTGLFIKCG